MANEYEGGGSSREFPIDWSIVEALGQRSELLGLASERSMGNLNMVLQSMPRESREALMNLYWEVINCLRDRQGLTIKVKRTQVPDYLLNLDIDLG